MKKKDYVQTHYTLDVNRKAQSASFWKGFSLFALLVTVALAVLCLYILKHKRVVGYVVEVDKTTGVSTFKENAVVPFEEYEPTLETKIYVLTSFVKEFWGVTVDENIQKEWIRRTYAKVEKGALNYVDGYYRENPPLALQKSERRDVEVYNVHRLTDDTFVILFRLSRWSSEGRLLGESNNKVSMHIRRFAPSTEYAREQNWFGIFIDDLSFSVIRDGVAADYDLTR